jgi:hypothetical protein
LTTTDKILYGTSTAITCTINSLASSATAGRQSTAVVNTSNLYVDALVEVIIATGSSAPTAPSYVAIYVSGSSDGTNFETDTAAIGTSDAAYTIDSPTNLRLARIINCSTASKTYIADFTIANLFGGIMPEQWIVVVCNVTGQTLNSSGNSMNYTGINYTNG